MDKDWVELHNENCELFAKFCELKKCMQSIIDSDNCVEAKKIMIDNRLFLHELSEDKNPDVRAYLARYGYFLDKFKDDSDWRVRLQAVRNYKDKSYFVNDKSYEVRMQVAQAGECLDILKNDENEIVRTIANFIIDRKRNE